MIVQKFRKKPVVVEAMQLIDDLANHAAIANWIHSSGGKVYMPALDPCLYIETLEGEMRADLGGREAAGAAADEYASRGDEAVIAELRRAAKAVGEGAAVDPVALSAWLYCVALDEKYDHESAARLKERYNALHLARAINAAADSSADPVEATNHG